MKMKKKLLFKNSTKYSKKVYDDFSRFHNATYSLMYDLYTLAVLGLLLYCLVVVIKSKLIFLIVIFSLCFIFFLGYRVFSPIIFYKKQVNKKSILKEKTFSFYFYDKYFKLRDNLNFFKISYFKLYRVYETEKFFYLYVNKKYAYLIDKNGFTFGNSKDFSKFIKSKVHIKYKKSNNS